LAGDLAPRLRAGCFFLAGDLAARLRAGCVLIGMTPAGRIQCPPLAVSMAGGPIILSCWRWVLDGPVPQPFWTGPRLAGKTVASIRDRLIPSL